MPDKIQSRIFFFIFLTERHNYTLKTVFIRKSYLKFCTVTSTKDNTKYKKSDIFTRVFKDVFPLVVNSMDVVKNGLLRIKLVSNEEKVDIKENFD